MKQEFDLLVIGAGVIGLAHALHAARRGLKVAVLDRDAQANGASIRNFGFVTVTGQAEHNTWRRARRARDVWAEIAPLAGIPVHHRGLLMAVRRPESVNVLQEFLKSPMGEGCRLLQGTDIPPPLRSRDLLAALHSPHELRVESREAIPRLAAWLEQSLDVRFFWRTAVHGISSGEVTTTQGSFAAPRIVACPGPDISTLFPDIFARRQVTLCKLHMLRLADPGWRLPAAIMSDLGLHRYRGYADCASLPLLRQRLQREQKDELDNGVHLIVVQSADGSLVVGDSHHYGPTPDPFQPEDVDALIIREAQLVLDLPAPKVVERWTGLYPSGPDDAFFEAPMPGVRLVSVTSGTGASTGFGLAEEVLADMEANP
ncbi:MAG: TIGR03364 family FAD-dependent oxidoreductase [Alphaproteobacteria bacterium]|nr:TIGR03364 family FAD-dependent oxidoreductase [Alphaproteobacteria bacterium]